MTKPHRWTIPLPYAKRDRAGKLCPVPPLTLNSRMNRHAERALKARIRSDAALLARSVQLPKGLVAVSVELQWQPRVHRPRDNDNIVLTLKPFVDGLVDYGLVDDDDIAHVRTSTRVFHATAGVKPFLHVVITAHDAPFNDGND